MGLATWFKEFECNLTISNLDKLRISNKRKEIVSKLNQDFWFSNSQTENSFFAGSYGRGTKILFSDIDLIFELPVSMYYSYNSYKRNGQAALLQDVRQSILQKYPRTIIKADGQVISVKFTDNTSIELLPAFWELDDTYTYADSNHGGTWKKTNPIEEIKIFHKMDYRWNGNLKKMCKIARAWKMQHSVNISGILLDTLVYNFLNITKLRSCTFGQYDFLSYEFFKFLSLQNQKQTFWYIPGSNQKAYRKGGFENEAKKSLTYSVHAIQEYRSNNSIESKKYWRWIYGNKFPK